MSDSLDVRSPSFLKVSKCMFDTVMKLKPDYSSALPT